LPSDPVDLSLGTRRARAAILMELALPGAVYLYQGEELGLPEVDDIPAALLADPVWERSGGTNRGRDGCRVPLPWTRTGPSLGFGAAAPWLPQPADWAELSAEAEETDLDSMLWLYRNALRLRCSIPDQPLTWLERGGEVIAFQRGPDFACVVNFGSAPVPLPDGDVLLTSIPMSGNELPSDGAVWIALR
jgi:alpha-glucosidase